MSFVLSPELDENGVVVGVVRESCGSEFGCSDRSDCEGSGGNVIILFSLMRAGNNNGVCSASCLVMLSPAESHSKLQ